MDGELMMVGIDPSNGKEQFYFVIGKSGANESV